MIIKYVPAQKKSSGFLMACTATEDCWKLVNSDIKEEEGLYYP